MTTALSLDAIDADLLHVYDGRTPADVTQRLATLIMATERAVVGAQPRAAAACAIARQLAFASRALAEHDHEAARRHIIEAIKRARRRTVPRG